jgi:hypothetical protein
MEFDSDYALLWPRFGHYRVEADKCVQIAARMAAKKCPLFGLFGVKWIEQQESVGRRSAIVGGMPSAGSNSDQGRQREGRKGARRERVAV